MGPTLASFTGNPALGPQLSFLLGTTGLLKYINLYYPDFLFEIFESDNELFNNKLINSSQLF